MSPVIASITEEYERYKKLGEDSLAQVAEPALSQPGPGGGNSLAVLVWHVAGNLRSRFTDFRTSDGEKPWRQRDEEFVERPVAREELMATWAAGWSVLFGALADLSDQDLQQTVRIRCQSLTIVDALHRSLAHTAMHVGQIVYLAKALQGDSWNCLSIPRGQSEAYNRAAEIQPPPTTTSSS